MTTDEFRMRIQEVLDSIPGALPDSWVLVFEMVTEDGSSMDVVASDHSPPWRDLGLLEAALMKVRGWVERVVQ